VVRRYSTKLTDEQWSLVALLLPMQTGPGHPRRIDLRQVVNALLYLDRTGC
jgi:putative transposase